MPGLRLAGLAVSIVVALTACSGGDDSGNEAPEADVTETPELAPPELTVPAEVPFDQNLTLEVQNGSITSAEVVTSDGGEVLDGAVNGAVWVSASPPLPATAYDVTVEASDADGESHTLTGSFTVAEVPDGQRLTLDVIRGGGDVVGVGMPIIVKFDQEVEDRRAVESAMHMASNPQVAGAWHWLSSQEVHFRPKEYWPAGTQIRVDLELNGVQAGEDLWGGRTYSYDIEVGDQHIAKVDASTHTFSLIKNGETVATWDTSLGAPEFATRTGTYVVLSKDREREMTSCNANITCDESSPEYYEVDTEFAVRLTNSGTFVHSAPWSETAQGEDNVSHGCLNLNETNAKNYFELAQYGDVVEVVNSTRPADDLVQRGDPGMVDWNLSWERLLAGSERGEFTTDAL
ncbi:MAG TPA: Ig-like domain-containing protein [Jiangellaceae bacterium]|nr:Ig-like domain-containing protein [Jiangellaceae bacterium]